MRYVELVPGKPYIVEYFLPNDIRVRQKTMYFHHVDVAPWHSQFNFSESLEEDSVYYNLSPGQIYRVTAC